VGLQERWPSTSFGPGDLSAVCLNGKDYKAKRSYWMDRMAVLRQSGACASYYRECKHSNDEKQKKDSNGPRGICSRVHHAGA